MKTNITIRIEDAAWRSLASLAPITRQAIRLCRKELDFRPGEDVELSLLLCGDAKIRELNKSWRGFDKATNVLSFPQAPRSKTALLGDIAISYQTLDREARAEEKRFLDHYRHLLVHGFLHLLGYDHETDRDAREMERIETRMLDLLGAPDPYASLCASMDRHT